MAVVMTLGNSRQGKLPQFESSQKVEMKNFLALTRKIVQCPVILKIAWFMRFIKITRFGVMIGSALAVTRQVFDHFPLSKLNAVSYLLLRRGLPGAAIFLVIFHTGSSFASELGIRNVYGGPASGGTCSTSCHSGSLSANATFTTPSSTIAHDSTSDVFTLSETIGGSRGFNIAIHGPSPGNPLVTGIFSDLSAGVKVDSVDPGQLTHTSARTETSWTFRWAAPPTLGTYTVYACVVRVTVDNVLTNDGAADCESIAIQVTNSNPDAVDDPNAITVNENSGLSVTFDVLANDTRTEDDAFSWDSDNRTGLVGILQHNGSGVYQYNPNGLFEDLDNNGIPETRTTQFQYTIMEDDYSATDTATVTITVQGANDAPVAMDDGMDTDGMRHVVIMEDEIATNVGDLLFNDSDVDTADAGSLTTVRTGPAVCSATAPTEASSFTLNTDGTFDYTHDGIDPITTEDSFSYCTFDGEDYSAPVMVYIDITELNDLPTIAGFSGSTGFTEQTPVVVDNDGITITDTDDTMIVRARLTISANYETGDTLACGTTPPAGISCGTFDIPSRTLTLSGPPASWVDYQTAVATVTFNNTSDNPGLGARTIDLDVRDDRFGDSLDSQKTITITRTNDPPTIAAIANQTALEDTAADPFTFNVNAVASDFDVDDDIDNGGGSLTYSLSGAPAGMTISNTNPTHGQISWNPPQTGVFGQVYSGISVLIEDGNEDISPPNSVSFDITVSPPDNEPDGVANYNDLCLSEIDSSNADFDGDGVAGADGAGTIGTPQHDNSGGDVCDADDDNDGISDVDELLNSLDPFDPTDALLDNDGDGVSNLDEINAGTNPNLANLTIDATGYLTPFDLPAPDPTSIHLLATSLTPSLVPGAASSSSNGPYRPGINDFSWTPSNSSSTDLAASDPGNLVSNPPVQEFRVRPLVNFAVNQLVEEADGAVSIQVTLNGDSPSWPATPVTVNYSVSGTANNPADHNAVAGAVVFNDQEYLKSINFATFGDAPLADPNETVVFTIDNANAAIGNNSTHTVTIIEGNVAPQTALQFTQAPASVVPYIFDGGGAVTVDALASDVNMGQAHSYDWSGTDNALVPPVVSNMQSWPPTIPGPGNYLIDVVVTDNGVPALSTRVTRILNVVAGGVVPLGAVDTDGDGFDDNHPTEGYTDDDSDGIPNYLDAIGGGGDSNLIPDQTVDFSISHLIMTDPGLGIAIGSTAQAANKFGVSLTDGEIAGFGSVSGGAPPNPDDNFDHFGGIYNFEISGLIPGSVAHVVIPLQTAIPKNAIYRKFNPATGWGNFVENANNSIASALGAPGACPEPGSSLYAIGLQYLHNCLQLTVQDGGPNDTDGLVNGVVIDPGTIGVRLTEPSIEEVEDGSGRISLQLLTLLVLLLGIGAWRQQRGGQTRLGNRHRI